MIETTMVAGGTAMNTQQVNAINGRVARAAEDLTTKGTKNTEKGESLADGSKRGGLPLFLPSIFPSLRSFVASFVDKAPDKARDKDGGRTLLRPLSTLRQRSGRAVYCSLFTGLLLSAFAPRAEAATPSQMMITFGGYTNRSETLTNFPVLVVLSNNVNGSGFRYDDFLSPNGYDLRFVDNLTDANRLNYEIESWNTNGASYIWVQVPTIPTNGQGAIWANWGNAAASNQLACTTNGATWTDGYVGVWHLNESGGPYVDSTANHFASSTNKPVNYAANISPTKVLGVSGNGQSFAGSTASYISYPSTNSPNPTGNITFECWVKTSVVNNNTGIFGRWAEDGAGDANQSFVIGSAGLSGNPLVILNANETPNGTDVTVATGSTTYHDGVWHHLSCSAPASGWIYVYKDGVQVGSSNNTTHPLLKTSTDHLVLGRSGYNGSMDEVRISTVARSSNWVWACYQTMASNAVFNNYGAMASQGASITVSDSSHGFGDMVVNTTGTWSYTVSGIGLTNNVTVTPPLSDFTISTDNVVFTSSPLTLTTNADGSVVATTIYVRFLPTVVQGYSGTITNSSAGFADKRVTLTGNGVATPRTQAATFYIDNAGSDTNTGLIGSPWQTSAKVNAFKFLPGDVLIFTAGQTFTGPFTFTNSGTAGAYICIGTGRGSTPVRVAQSNPAIISAGNGNGINLDNCEYVWVDNLIVSGSGVNTTNGATTSTGCAFNLKSTQTINKLHGVRLTAVTATGCKDGIVSWTPDASKVGYDGLQVWGSTVHACQRVGMIQLNYDLEHDTGTFASGSPAQNANTYFGYCQVYDNPGLAGVCCGSGMDIRNCTDGEIDHCVVRDLNIVGTQPLFGGGTAGIASAVAVRTTVRFCEAYNIFAPANIDGVGIDFESGASGCVVEYSYFHDNDGAGLLTGGSGQNTNNIVRYNVFARNAKNNQSELYPFGGGISMTCYNNTFYGVNGDAINVSGGAFCFYNNIIVSKAGRKCVNGTPTALRGNVYFALGGGTTTVMSYTTLAALRAAGFEAGYGVFGDPLLSSPMSGVGIGAMPAADVSTITYFDLAGPASPAIDAGVDLRAAPFGFTISRDFAGSAVSGPGYDIGAVCYPRNSILTSAHIENRNVTSVTTNSATFNGMLTSTGTAAMAVCVLWGETTNVWANTNWWNSGNPDPTLTNNTPFSTNITSGILSGKTYYYTFAVTNAATNAVASAPVSFITGESSVLASDPLGRSTNGDSLAFTVYRPATCTNESMAVNYTLGGTAIQGTDYSITPASGAVIFAPGTTNVAIRVTPVYKVDSQKSVVLTLAAGAYAIGARNSATGTLAAVVLSATPSQMKITFGGYTNRSEVLTNFPVLVVLSNNVGGSSSFNYNNFATTSGYDLRFATNSTPTTNSLNYEIESWNTNGASYVWVQVPTIPTNGTGAIWANWGNTAASTQLTCTTNGTSWDSNFKGVYHLKETGTNPQVKDSTANGYNSSAQAWTPTTGQIGGGGSFTAGSSQYVDINTNPIISTFTISGWVKSTATFVLFDNRYSTPHGVALYIDSSNGQAGYYSYFPDAVSLYSTPSNITDGNWHYIAASYNGTTAKIYADSSAPASQTRTYTNTSISTKFSMAKVGFIPVTYSGSSDELRVSTVIRSDNWLWAEYLNAASNTVFNNYGKMEAIIPPPKGTVVMLK